MRGVPYGLVDNNIDSNDDNINSDSDLPIEPVPKAQAYPIGTAAELWLVQASTTASSSVEVSAYCMRNCTRRNVPMLQKQLSVRPHSALSCVVEIM
jgi:hypothetical protein